MKLHTRALLKARRIGLEKADHIRKRTRVALIGGGRIAPEHISGFTESGIAKVVAVADTNPTVMANTLRNHPDIRMFRNAEQMLREIKPEIVDICTWPDSHAALVKLAVAGGVKAIICEKPLALTMSEVDDIVETCNKAGVKLAIGHQYRFHPNFIKARQVISSGGLGKLKSVRAYIADSLANNGPHLFDTLRFLLSDARATAVRAECIRTSNSFNRGWPVEDSSTGEVFFEDGLTAHFTTGTAAPIFFGFEIEGERGKLSVEPDSLKVDGRVIRQADSDYDYYSCRRNQFTEMVRWVRGGASYPADGKSSKLTAEIVLAAYASAHELATIRLPLENRSDIIRTLYPSDNFHTLTPIRGLPFNPSLAMDGASRTVREWYPEGPDIGREEIVGVTKVLLSKKLGSTVGGVVKKLEREFAQMYGSPLAVASTSGTASLHVAVAAVNPEPGDEIITTPMSDMGTVIPILFANCIPIFADIDPLSGNLTAETIARKITPRTRAVIVVHLFGRPADLTPIRKLLHGTGIALIEDCSQAHYADYANQKIGTIGDFGCFSLQQAKHITCGDGGLTLVNNPEYELRAKLFVDKGWNRGSGKRAHLFLGLNYRMTEMQGAVARAQIQKLDRLVRARQRTADMLCDRLRSIPGILVPNVGPGTRSAWWIFNFCIDHAVIPYSADAFFEAIQCEGLSFTRTYLPRPLFDEEMFVEKRLFGTHGFPLRPEDRRPTLADFPGLKKFFEEQIITSWSSQVSDHHVAGIAEAIAKVAKAARA